MSKASFNENKPDLKIGVFLCRCGGNISDTIDMEKLRSSVNAEVVEEFENLCSINGRKIIRDNIIQKNLDRVVVAACSPITHEKTFQNYVNPLNPYLLEMANIREQCSWVNPDNNTATEKAISLVNAAIEKVKYSQPLDPILRKTPKTAAVIGGGISGISASLSLARQGIKTCLIEEEPTIGGSMVKVGKLFSPEKLAEECAMCLLNPLVNEAVQHKNIKIMTNTTLKAAERRAGNFNLLIENKARKVMEDKCISCGSCAEVCPVEVEDSWNEGMTIRKAIYKPFPQAVPDVYTIDPENCKECGKCQDTCRMNAIDLSMEGEVIPMTVGSVVIATGHKTFDMSKRPEYSYGRHKDIVTQMELARIMGVNGPTKGKLLKPSDGQVPQRVVMIQCVGSRDEKPGGRKYCSKVCCMVAIKHANVIKQHYPDTDVIICYTDMRTPGMYEKYFKYAQSNEVRLIRGRPGEIEEKDGIFIVRLEDTLSREPMEIETDLVVLSTAMEPSEGTIEVSNILDVGLTEELFVKEKHSKIKPVATEVEGIYVCGTAQGPKDITDSIVQANAAAAKVSELINGGVELEPFVATIDNSKCNLCKKCIDVCKYKAAFIQDDVLNVDPVSCIGCGACLWECENNAIEIMGQTDEQILSMITGILKDKKPGETRIITFLDSVGYISADNIGINKINVPSSIRIIKIPSMNRIMPKHILHAFNMGVDGIIMGEYPYNPMYSKTKERIKGLKQELLKNNIDPDRLAFYKVYIPYFRGLANRFNEFDNEIRCLEEN
jgi:heterodisulfide reductase subunit A1